MAVVEDQASKAEHLQQCWALGRTSRNATKPLITVKIPSSDRALQRHKASADVLLVKAPVQPT